MFCENCGASRIDIQSNYCPNCGKKMIKPDEVNSEGKSSRYLSIALPLTSLLVVPALLYMVHVNEKSVNAEVLEYQERAEQAALTGDYSKALLFIEKGLANRSEYEVLLKEKEMILSLEEFDQDLSQIEQHIMNENFEIATKSINLLKSQVVHQKSPLYVQLSHKIHEAETTVKVGEIKQELAELETIDQLEEKLSTLYALELEEAAEVETQIHTKMVLISSKEAEQELADKHFNRAIYTIDEALQYVVNNEKLLSIKDKITEEKSSFEQAEQKRIESAIVAAKKEEERNRTEAVKVRGVELNVDKYGDAYIKGEVLNSGTKEVHSISIQFVVKDASGKEVEKGETNVFPNELQPGDSAKFEHVTYSAKEDAKIEVKHISWYLKEKKG
ncbi:FxLYD domain-containing protein [Metabacillus herbersteinensis]|uniref:FxLYD domain-containing protein n=1 Tax=Metabacillus herbersteinensis TaxID=283816 RepID=A0ABV6GLH2_9BACI